jgi:hypothetical protein
MVSMTGVRECLGLLQPHCKKDYLVYHCIGCHLSCLVSYSNDKSEAVIRGSGLPCNSHMCPSVVQDSFVQETDKFTIQH